MAGIQSEDFSEVTATFSSLEFTKQIQEVANLNLSPPPLRTKDSIFHKFLFIILVKIIIKKPAGEFTCFSLPLSGAQVGEGVVGTSPCYCCSLWRFKTKFFDQVILYHRNESAPTEIIL